MILRRRLAILYLLTIFFYALDIGFSYFITIIYTISHVLSKLLHTIEYFFTFFFLNLRYTTTQIRQILEHFICPLIEFSLSLALFQR